jgi:hypothetical protein
MSGPVLLFHELTLFEEEEICSRTMFSWRDPLGTYLVHTKSYGAVDSVTPITIFDKFLENKDKKTYMYYNKIETQLE